MDNEKLKQALKDSSPMDEINFKKAVPPVCGAHYMIRREGDPNIGIVMLNNSGMIEAPGNERPMNPADLLSMPLPYWFGPRVEIGYSEGGQMVLRAQPW